jgi:L-cysteine:1D-myo-inositol 2-amino-2-deoxy-alpha-D-glucopyranoside ligase
MRLYNTRSKEIEEFVVRDNQVRMYVCGITPYDTTHTGHAFTYVVFDVLARYLRFLGHRVRYVQNVTDIDDDILKRAKKVGLSWDQLGTEQTAQYVRDMAAMNVQAPDVFPRASGEIAKIVEIVSTLVQRGWAYESGGSVYFRARSDPEFGSVSNLPPDLQLAVANERGNYPDDPFKEDPLDFVLWQAGKPGEPTWDSPWGPGRPGWHIECSAMSLKYLGDTIDIHGGGADLTFPHHDAETVQSERYTGKKPFVRFWVHTAMVRLDGEKMSKSLGNLVLVRDVLREHSADALRLYLLSFHYRESWSYERRGVEDAAGCAETLLRAASVFPRTDEAGILDPAPYRERFLAAMDDDLQTPAAVSVLRELAGAILRSVDENVGVGEAQLALRDLGGILGLTFTGSPCIPSASVS